MSKVRSSLRNSRKRSKTCMVVRRKGILFVRDKVNPRNNVRQG